MTRSVLEPTWRPKAAQDAPKRPQASIFTRFWIDLGSIWVSFSMELLMILDIILDYFRF